VPQLAEGLFAYPTNKSIAKPVGNGDGHRQACVRFPLAAETGVVCCQLTEYVFAANAAAATVVVAFLISRIEQERWMVNKVRKTKRVAWSKANDRTLKAHSRRKTPVVKISKEMKRTIGALRQRALKLEMPLGHRR
jgi:hypothetical protein